MSPSVFNERNLVAWSHTLGALHWVVDRRLIDIAMVAGWALSWLTGVVALVFR